MMVSRCIVQRHWEQPVRRIFFHLIWLRDWDTAWCSPIRFLWYTQHASYAHDIVPILTRCGTILIASYVGLDLPVDVIVLDVDLIPYTRRPISGGWDTHIRYDVNIFLYYAIPNCRCSNQHPCQIHCKLQAVIYLYGLQEHTIVYIKIQFLWLSSRFKNKKII